MTNVIDTIDITAITSTVDMIDTTVQTHNCILI